MSTPTGPIENLGPRARILLVDDEPHILQALQRELRREPYELTAYSRPEQAREVLEGQSFAAVISDNMMPGLTGLELLAWLKEHAPLTRRILLTGQTSLNEAVEAFNNGAIHRYFNKPWNREELCEALHEEMGHWQEAVNNAALEQTARKRSLQLRDTVEELKQTRTQLLLHEEGPSLSRILPSPRLRGMHFLVVDEHDGVRELLVSTLKRVGIAHVEAVGTARDALAYVQSSPLVDVVLSEWKMSEMDGLALFHAIRSGAGPSANALFLLVTTREHRTLVEFALKSGVDGYLLKPFHLKSLLEQVEKLTQGRHKENLEKRILELRPLSIIAANIELESRTEIQHLLTAAGVQNVAIADSGQKALRWIREKRPDVFIYDCNLRDPYWLELQETLASEDPPVAFPPLVLTSVVPVQKEYEEVSGAGLTTFVPGPIQRRELFRAILRALEAAGQA